MKRLPQDVELARRELWSRFISGEIDYAGFVDASRRFIPLSERRLWIRDGVLSILSDAVVEFSERLSGKCYRVYQRRFAHRICMSLLREDGEELTTLWARQMGKTETLAMIVPALCIMLPLYSFHFDDPRFTKYGDGLRVGLFAPTLEQADYVWDRMRRSLLHGRARELLRGGNFGVEFDERNFRSLRFSNGSFVGKHSGAVQGKREGATYNLLLLEECQDLDDMVITKEIAPMGAATKGTMVKIGTCNLHRGEFWRSCERNKRSDLSRSRGYLQRHFEFDYQVGANSSQSYLEYVANQLDKLGYESDAFKMSFRLIWPFSSGMFLSSSMKEQMLDSGLNLTDSDSSVDRVYGAGLDLGKTLNPTVLTIGRIGYDAGIDYGREKRYPIEVVSWRSWLGDDHVTQCPEILSALLNFSGLRFLCVDSTGKGEPVYELLRDACKPFGIVVIPYKFSVQSKHRGWTLLDQEIKGGRFRVAGSKTAVVQRRFKEFMSDMDGLTKSWNGIYMVCNKDTRDKNSRDDYCDSAMLLCMGVYDQRVRESSIVDNPFRGSVSPQILKGGFDRFGLLDRTGYDIRRESRRGKALVRGKGRNYGRRR